MGALYDSIGPFPPAWPAPWHVWMKVPERTLMILQPSGAWAPWRELSTPGLGRVPLSAPLFGGSLAGKHGLLPSAAAIARESLKKDGSPVATLEHLDEIRLKILKQFAPKANVSGISPPRDIKKLYAGSHGILLMVSDDEPVEMPPDMVPSAENVQMEWKNCHVDLSPLFCTYSAGLRGTRCRILTAAEQATVYKDRNYDYPMGVWVRRTADSASGVPQFRAYGQGRDGIPLTIACSYSIMGVQ